MFNSWNILELLNYFVDCNITSLSDFEKLTIDDLNRIVSSHRNFQDIIKLREKFDSLKKARCVPTSSIEAVQNQFSDYLRATVNGRIILQKHNSEPKDLLTSLEKQFILRRAVDFMLLKVENFPKEFPRESEYTSMWQKIDTAFEGVFTKSELLGKKLLTAEGKTISSTRGKMQQRVYDVSKHLKADGQPKQKKKKDEATPQLSVESDENVEDDTNLNDFDNLKKGDDMQQIEKNKKEDAANKLLDFLRKNKGPEEKVLEAWKITFLLRRGYVFEDFPALKMRFGYKLICFDFKQRHGDKIEEFKVGFKDIKKSLLIQYNTEVTDKYGKELLKFLSQNLGSETVDDLLHLMLLPFLFKHSNSKNRISVAERSKYFICHVKVSFT